eukprot:scaffold65836_cov54-Phaeocystis_antarctica.AAC.4
MLATFLQSPNHFTAPRALRCTAVHCPRLTRVAAPAPAWATRNFSAEGRAAPLRSPLRTHCPPPPAPRGSHRPYIDAASTLQRLSTSTRRA